MVTFSNSAESQKLIISPLQGEIVLFRFWRPANSLSPLQGGGRRGLPGGGRTSEGLQLFTEDEQVASEPKVLQQRQDVGEFRVLRPPLAQPLAVVLQVPDVAGGRWVGARPHDLLINVQELPVNVFVFRRSHQNS